MATNGEDNWPDNLGNFSQSGSARTCKSEKGAFFESSVSSLLMFIPCRMVTRILHLTIQYHTPHTVLNDTPCISCH